MFAYASRLRDVRALPLQCREAAACELLADYVQADRQYKLAYHLLSALLTNDPDTSDKAVINTCMSHGLCACSFSDSFSGACLWVICFVIA